MFSIFRNVKVTVQNVSVVTQSSLQSDGLPVFVILTSFQHRVGCSSFLLLLLLPPPLRLLRGWTAVCSASPGHVTPCRWSRGRCPETSRRLLRSFSRVIITELPLTSLLIHLPINFTIINQSTYRCDFSLCIRVIHEGKCQLTHSSKDSFWIPHLFIHPRHPQSETLQPIYLNK